MQLLKKESHLREVNIFKYKEEEVTTTLHSASNVSLSLEQSKTEVLNVSLLTELQSHLLDRATSFISLAHLEALDKMKCRSARVIYGDLIFAQHCFDWASLSKAINQTNEVNTRKKENQTKPAPFTAFQLPLQTQGQRGVVWKKSVSLFCLRL